jgi:ubiquinone/menaquinone biosynthesis C-methylase UbiE
MALSAEEYYDRHATEYDTSYDEKWVEIYDRVTWEKTIQPYLPADRTAQILDAGGGTAKWTIPLAEAGYNVTLTDISKNMLTVARAKIAQAGLIDRVRVEVADVTQMAVFEDASFDFVLCEGDPLSYCTNPPQGIEELVRVAKVGGTIVASVDNLYSRVFWHLRRQSFQEALGLFEDQWVTGNFPVYFFTPSELQRRFDDAGCEMITMVGKNLFSRYWSEDRLKDAETFQEVVALELEHSENPHLLGYAGHIAIVCRKER